MFSLSRWRLRCVSQAGDGNVQGTFQGIVPPVLGGGVYRTRVICPRSAVVSVGGLSEAGQEVTIVRWPVCWLGM